MELYKLEEAYFVVDGHHRVSVARYHDVPTLEAAVAEFHPNRLRWAGTCDGEEQASSLVPLIHPRCVEDEFLEPTRRPRADREQTA